MKNFTLCDDCGRIAERWRFLPSMIKCPSCGARMLGLRDAVVFPLLLLLKTLVFTLSAAGSLLYLLLGKVAPEWTTALVSSRGEAWLASDPKGSKS